MNLIQSIAKAIEKREPSEVPEGYCPNCWGRQEYSGYLFSVLHREKIDLTNLDSKKGWIQEYAAKRLYSIKLQERGDEFVCGTCSIS